MREEEKKGVEKVAMAMVLALSIGLIVVTAYPKGWHLKTSHIWSFNFGLFNVEIKLDTLAGGMLLKGAESVIGKKKVAKMKQVIQTDEPKSIQFYRDQFCNIDMLSGGALNSCHVWTMLYYGGVLAGVALMLAVAFNLAGIGCMFLPPSRRWRLIVVWLWAIGAAMAMGGVVGWACVTYPLANWLTNVQMAHSGTTYSFMSLVAGVLSMLTPIPAILLLFFGNIPKSDFEGQAWVEPYGAAGYGSTGAPPGWNPSMGPPPPGMPPPGMGEKRIDPSDGNPYMLEEFIAVYGGSPVAPPPQWHSAQPAFGAY